MDALERFGAVRVVVAHNRVLPRGLTPYNGNPLDVCITTDAVNSWQGGQHYFLAVDAYNWELRAERRGGLRVYDAPGMQGEHAALGSCIACSMKALRCCRGGLHQLPLSTAGSALSTPLQKLERGRHCRRRRLTGTSCG